MNFAKQLATQKDELEHDSDDDSKDEADDDSSAHSSDSGLSHDTDIDTSSSESDWDDLIAFNKGANTLIMEENTCTKFFPCCASCCGPKGPGVHRQQSKGTGQTEEHITT
eukprot:98517_1